MNELHFIHYKKWFGLKKVFGGTLKCLIETNLIKSNICGFYLKPQKREKKLMPKPDELFE